MSTFSSVFFADYGITIVYLGVYYVINKRLGIYLLCVTYIF